MMEAIFTLIGVVLGAVLKWLQTYWTKQKRDSKKCKIPGNKDNTDLKSILTSLYWSG